VQPDQMTSSAWYVVATPTGREEYGDRDLREIGFRTFFPHFCDFVEIKGDPKRSRFIRLAYFPGYLFVEHRPGGPQLHRANEKDKRRLLCGTADAEGFAVPAPVPVAEMRRFLAIADPAGQIHDPTWNARKTNGPARFSVGNRVRFTEESRLFGFFAAVEEIMPGGKSLRVRLEAAMLGRQSVVVAMRQLTKA